MTESRPKRKLDIFLRLVPGGIRERLFLLIALVLLPMLILLGWMNYKRYQIRYAEAVQTELAVAQGIANSFSALLDDVRRSSFAVGEAIATFPPNSAAQATGLLTAVAAQNPKILDLNWVSPAGAVLASNRKEMVGADLSDRLCFRETLAGKAWAVGDLVMSRKSAEAPTFGIATAIQNRNGRLLGVVIAEIDPTRLEELALTQRRRTGSAFALFDRQGTLVYRFPETELSWDARVRWKESDPLLRKFLETGEPQTGKLRHGIQGLNCVLARVPVPEAGWGAGAGQQVETALAVVRNRLTYDFLLTALIAPAALLLAWYLAGSIARPLLRLEQDAEDMGLGRVRKTEDPIAPKEVRRLRAAVTLMATDLLRQSEALRESEERFRATYEQAAVGMAHVGLDGRFLRVNRKLCEIVGYSREELMQKTSTELTFPEDLAAGHVLMEKLLKGETLYYQTEKRYIHKDGRLVWIHLTVALQRGRDDKVEFAIAVIEDISARKAMESELMRAKKAAEEGIRAKSEFLANMSHEIRTPMTVILAALEQISLSCTQPEQQRYMQMAENSAERLLSLIDDILDISRIEAHGVELVQEPFDLYACVEEATLQFNLQAAGKKIGLALDIDSRVPRHVLGAPQRLFQILINLIGNAVKFTACGAVTVKVDPPCGGGNNIRIAVCDTGVGIPVEKLDLLFKRFSQVDSSLTRKHGGTGLGLSISKGLIELMGGEIRVESKDGEGSTFSVLLPLPPAAECVPDPKKYFFSASSPRTGLRG